MTHISNCHQIAAKQEAFEESLKLKNQFRPLDEDEVDFLDSVVESERAKDNALREADREQLKRFRQQQEAADRGSESALDPTKDSASSVTRANAAQDRQWAVGGKKRRRRSDKEILRGVNKLRKASSADTDVPTPSSIEEGVETTQPLIQGKDSHSESVKRLDTAEKAAKSSPDIISASTAKPTNPTGLGLGAYDSDSD